MKGVITGDIVRSTAVGPALRTRLLEAVRKTAQELEMLSDLKIELYRGDSFQILVDDPVQALRIAVLLRAGLRCNTPDREKSRWDARLAVGVGEIEYASGEVATSDGPAFRNSGREFDELGKKRLAVRTPWPEVNDELRVSTAFADDVISGWTPRQSPALYLSLLHPMNQREIAAVLSQSGQNVSKLLGAGREPLIRLYLERYELLVSRKIAP
ncbi:hypothetical protein [Alistipes sp.]|uniref:hypothetical protein n=1 Tax=Alistipes sp. TaxID=1872444 RepID=UPI003AF1B6BC